MPQITDYLVDETFQFAETLEETQTTGTQTKRTQYTWGNELISANVNDSVTNGPVESEYEQDGLGSIMSISDINGNAAVRYQYGAFGETYGTTEDDVNPYRYGGEYADSAISMQYNRLRWYSTGVAGFISMDSSMGNERNPNTLNKYIYASDDPLNVKDPSGNFGLAEINVAVSVASALASGYQIGTGMYELSEGNYKSGFIDVGLGFMGCGVLAKLPFSISAASKLLSQHRNVYISLVEGMASDIEKLRVAGKTEKEIAVWAIARRNEIKVYIRALMISEASSPTEYTLALLSKKYAEIRNYFLYWDPIGPELNYFLKNRKTYDSIIDGAMRTSDDITEFFNTTGWGLLP